MEQQLEQKRKELALEQQNLEQRQKELGLGRKLGQKELELEPMEQELEQTRWIQGTQWCRWFRHR